MERRKETGIDILRIISMLGIISLHVFNKGGVLNASEDDSLTRFVSEMMIIASYCSVNVFAMMSGYLYCEKTKINYRNLKNLLLTTAFWCILITVLHLIFNPAIFESEKEIIISFFPPIGGRYWYITSYVLLFLMIPYMNKLVELFDKELFEKLLITLFVMFSIVSTFGIFDYFRIKQGYSPFWLMFCYLVGAYFKKYGFFRNMKNKYISKKNAILLFVLNTFLVLCSWEVIKVVTETILGKAAYVKIFSEYISPFMVVNAIALLYIFSGIYLEHGKINRSLSLIAKVAFDVYIIHSHYLIFEYYIGDAFTWIANLPLLNYIIVVTMVIILIYIGCGICGLVRIKLFESIEPVWKKLKYLMSKK